MDPGSHTAVSIEEHDVSDGEESLDPDAIEEMTERNGLKNARRIKPAMSNEHFPSEEKPSCKRRCGMGLYYFWRAVYHSKRIMQGLIVIVATTASQHAARAANLDSDTSSTYGAIAGIVVLATVLLMDLINIQCAISPRRGDPDGPSRFSELHWLSVLHFLLLVAMLIGSCVALVKMKVGCDHQMRMGAQKCNLERVFASRR